MSVPGNGVAGEWRIQGKPAVLAIRNRIRETVERIKFEECPGKELIELTIGDPTKCGLYPPHPEMVRAVCEVAEAGLDNGYNMARGSLSARTALAEKHSCPDETISPDDVFLANGCSEAIEFCFRAVCSPGQNLLTPCPGFGLYGTLCCSLGLENRLYRLDPQRSWEADLKDLEAKIDSQSAAILVNNPSNPCGAVYSKQHLLDIIQVAERHRLPIIADEVYAGMVFSGNTFHSVASLSRAVPVLSCGSLAKRWLVPGWRLGWVILHNRKSILSEDLYTSIDKLATCVLGPCALIQGALPRILSVPQSWHDDVTKQIESTALTCYETLVSAPGITPIKPQGAMYIMIEVDFSRFPSAPNVAEFVRILCKETSVKLLPCSCFEFDTAVRIVTIGTQERMREACERICEFCRLHFTP